MQNKDLPNILICLYLAPAPRRIRTHSGCPWLAASRSGVLPFSSGCSMSMFGWCCSSMVTPYESLYLTRSCRCVPATQYIDQISYLYLLINHCSTNFNRTTRYRWIHFATRRHTTYTTQCLGLILNID